MEEIQGSNGIESPRGKPSQNQNGNKKSFGDWWSAFWMDGARITSLLMIMLIIVFIIMFCVSIEVPTIEVPTSHYMGTVKTTSISLLLYWLIFVLSGIFSGEIWGIIIGVLAIAPLPLMIISLVSLVRFCAVGGDNIGIAWTANVAILILFLFGAFVFSELNSNLDYAIRTCGEYGIDLEAIAKEMGYSLDISPFVKGYYAVGVIEILLSIVRCIFADSKPIKINRQAKFQSEASDAKNEKELL